MGRGSWLKCPACFKPFVYTQDKQEWKRLTSELINSGEITYAYAMRFLMTERFEKKT